MAAVETIMSLCATSLKVFDDVQLIIDAIIVIQVKPNLT